MRNPDTYWKRDAIPLGNQFPNQTFHWFGSDRAHTYKRESSIYGHRDILYQFNSRGYRSIEYDALSDSNKVLFLGDSVTMGVGLPYQDVWTSQLAHRIGLEQHNYGVGGCSNELIAQIACQTIPLLKPKLVVVMFTSLSRRSYYTSDGLRHDIRLGSNWPGQPIEEKQAIAHYQALQNDNNDFFEFLSHYRLIEAYCGLTNTPWVWSNWSKEYDFSIMGDYTDSSRYVEMNATIDFARDGSHPGPKTNAMFSDAFFKHHVIASELSLRTQS
jgi:hypothetical protein